MDDYAGLKERIIKMAIEQVDVEELKFIRENPESIVLEDISGCGFVNDVIRVRIASGTSVVCKLAMPYHKHLGPNVALPVERGRIEYRYSVTCEQICPGSVARPYCYSETYSAYVMEDLSDYDLMMDNLMAGIVQIDAVERIAQFLGRLQRTTHVTTLTKNEFVRLQSDFKNDKMVNPMMEYNIRQWCESDEDLHTMAEEVKTVAVKMYADLELIRNVAEMRAVFGDKKECLVHNDLHTCSIMTKYGDAKIIDGEFASVGPCAQDVGVLLAHYLLAYIRHMTMFREEKEKHKTIADVMLRAVRLTLDIYLSEMKTCLPLLQRRTVVSEIAGFAGVELCRRVFGGMRALEVSHSVPAELMAVHMGMRLLRTHNAITDEARLLQVVLDLQ